MDITVLYDAGKGAALAKFARIFVVLAIGLIAADAAQAQDVSRSTATKVTIQVVDPAGAAINAQIRIAPTPVQPPPSEIGKSGVLIFALPQGSYDLLLASPGFSPQAKHIDLHSDPVTISVVMPVCSSEVCRDMIVDTFSTKANPGLLISAGPLHSQALSLDTLKSFPHHTVTIHDPHANAEETYSGVPLVDLLVKVGVPHGHDLRGKALAQYIVATGSDGYKAVVALAEADPDFHPGEVLVVDQMDGKPLDAKTGFSPCRHRGQAPRTIRAQPDIYRSEDRCRIIPNVRN
jgi:hypothetical protein